MYSLFNNADGIYHLSEVIKYSAQQQRVSVCMEAHDLQSVRKCRCCERTTSELMITIELSVLECLQLRITQLKCGNELWFYCSGHVTVWTFFFFSSSFLTVWLKEEVEIIKPRMRGNVCV